jgi:hypothetical protein
MQSAFQLAASVELRQGSASLPALVHIGRTESAECSSDRGSAVKKGTQTLDLYQEVYEPLATLS